MFINEFALTSVQFQCPSVASLLALILLVPQSFFIQNRLLFRDCSSAFACKGFFFYCNLDFNITESLKLPQMCKASRPQMYEHWRFGVFGFSSVLSPQEKLSVDVFRCFCLSRCLVVFRTTRCTQLHKQQCVVGAPKDWAIETYMFYGYN